MPRNSTNYVITGTKTFRLGSRQLITGQGSNMQNWEKSLRRMYIPDKGKCFVQVDQAGAEALIVSRLLKPENKLRLLFENNIKPHQYIGLMLPFQWEKEFPWVHDLAKVKIEELKGIPEWAILKDRISQSDNNPPATRYYYHYKQTCHCVDSETEVLTQEGWKKVSELDKSVAIASFNIQNRNIQFEIPEKWTVENYQGSMIYFAGAEINQFVTPNHKMPYKTNDKIQSLNALKLSFRKSFKIPNSGFYVGGNANVTNLQAKLVVAIQADGNIQSPNAVRFHFVKQRKIDRMISLLDEGKYEYNLKKDSSNSKAVFISVKGISDCIKWFNINLKRYGSWLLSWSAESLDTLLEELHHWDGTRYNDSRNREEYDTAILQNARWIKTILQLRGKQGTISNSHNTCYKVGINQRQFATIDEEATIHSYNGLVYCPTVSTGFFLVRREGKISVTGNSANYAVREAAFALNILEKSGGKVVLSPAQARAYLGAYHTLLPELIEWWNDVRTQLFETHTLYNLFGHPYYFHTVNDSMLKDAYAIIPQGSVGCITHRAYIDMQNHIESTKIKWDLLGNCHDSYLIQCPIEERYECAKKAQEFMNVSFNFRGETFSMKSEAQWGYNWSPQSSYNPFGLREFEKN